MHYSYVTTQVTTVYMYIYAEQKISCRVVVEDCEM